MMIVNEHLYGYIFYVSIKMVLYVEQRYLSVWSGSDSLRHHRTSSEQTKVL